MSFQLTNSERQVVIDAYRNAIAARKGSVDCYTAGVDALHRLYPGALRELVANEAVKILTTDVKLVDVARRRRDSYMFVR
jgi:hypothetical protein